MFCGESAGSTKELGLAGPVSFVDVAAVGAALAGVRGVHLDHRHSGAGCFVGEESAELGEGPAGVCGALGLAEPYPFADTGQFFDRYPASGAFSLGHDPRGDLVVDVGGGL